jgi:ABC-type lipoprotein release transport system permease subunit
MRRIFLKLAVLVALAFASIHAQTPVSRPAQPQAARLKHVVSDLPPSLERVDFYNYGEPFLYYRLVVASYLPARRAANADPVCALRSSHA